MNINALPYEFFIDPLLSGLRKTVARIIPPDTNVIDIACGTGALAFLLATHGRHVTGIDISECMIDNAEKKRHKLAVQHLAFFAADATNLHRFRNHEFDFSVMSLALHQFEPETRDQVLREAMRISKKVILADYAIPLPRNFYGRFAKIIETLAGKEHYRYFRNYCSSGGLLKTASNAGLKADHMIISGNGVFTLGIFEPENIRS